MRDTLNEQWNSSEQLLSNRIQVFNHVTDCETLKQAHGTDAEQYLSNYKMQSIKSQACRKTNVADALSTIQTTIYDYGKIQYHKCTSNWNKPRLREINGIQKALGTCINISRKQGVHSVIALEAAGLHYTNVGDTTRCDRCQLEVTGWTLDMHPFKVHADLRPNCEFVKKLKPLAEFQHSNALQTEATCATLSVTNASGLEKPSKRQKVEVMNRDIIAPALIEVDMIKQIRRRTFSHWMHRNSPIQAQIIEAGFFNCNVGDRVICIYCDLVCQQWTPHTDDPCEVHRVLSPRCPFVVNMLMRREAVSLSIINQNSEANGTSAPTASDAFHSHEIVRAVACNSYYLEIPKRYQSFATWPNDPLPSADDLVRAGFYYTGTGTIVTCFFCNGSLQNWGVKDNPAIEHARWFPHCGYAKQLCGEDLYRKIQESKRSSQERTRSIQSPTNPTGSVQKLQISDEATLSRFVAARLDLPVSQKLILVHNYKLSIVKRCWEDQLRLKLDDFYTDCDLMMACTILQKQISSINGNKEKIIVPSVKMRQIREKLQSEIVSSQPSIPASSAVISINSSNTSDVDMTTVSQSSVTQANVKIPTNQVVGETKISQKTSTANSVQSIQLDNTDSKNTCALCMTEEKSLACIPCGHLSTCVACGHSVRSCPICRQKIEAYVRVYI
ncbi:unnamed protein product [Rotaria socialis]|uniref:RING-type domain-containing protein n=1 Tax=Rotaria socialis TaxID=392032 RepID=A0A818RKF9_9BILA|nr:unnamed protein product [Rotaria socialis]CAF3544888.1 unnamed protein product [Rotaria socialis]CAF3592088.1 unnamed protein product [Rotaria socialis]CAF3655267.1 unnamed protein product [Rotaria socialis]CAF3778257.1 unnamed protein product [Rotaria socialis]